MLKEDYLKQLLEQLYKEGPLSLYDHAANVYGTTSGTFQHSRGWAHQLVKEKLAHYTDDEHTTLEISNYGRYWMIHGGYDIFLKDWHREKEHHNDQTDPVDGDEDSKEHPFRFFLHEHERTHHSKEELLEARWRLTKYRMMGFWVGLLLSMVGFIMSLVNFYLLFKFRIK